MMRGCYGGMVLEKTFSVVVVMVEVVAGDMGRCGGNGLLRRWKDSRAVLI